MNYGAWANSCGIGPRYPISAPSSIHCGWHSPISGVGACPRLSTSRAPKQLLETPWRAACSLPDRNMAGRSHDSVQRGRVRIVPTAVPRNDPAQGARELLRPILSRRCLAGSASCGPTELPPSAESKLGCISRMRPATQALLGLFEGGASIWPCSVSEARCAARPFGSTTKSRLLDSTGATRCPHRAHRKLKGRDWLSRHSLWSKEPAALMQPSL